MLKYRSPSCKLEPSALVDGLLEAIWYVSPKALMSVKLVATVLTLAIEPPTLFILVMLPATVLILDELVLTAFTLAILFPTFAIAVALLATVVTSVALGTNLWKVYVCNVLVDSTKNPNPWAIVLGTPVIVIFALLAKLPLVIVTVVPVGTKSVVAALYLKQLPVL